MIEASRRSPTTNSSSICSRSWKTSGASSNIKSDSCASNEILGNKVIFYANDWRFQIVCSLPPFYFAMPRILLTFLLFFWTGTAGEPTWLCVWMAQPGRGQLIVSEDWRSFPPGKSSAEIWNKKNPINEKRLDLFLNHRRWTLTV